MNIDVKNYGNNGVAFSEGQAVLSFSISGADQRSSIDELKDGFNNYLVIGDRLRLQNYTVATHGLTNLLPNEAKFLIKNNPILPGILKKQIRINYGHGYGLYKDDHTGEKPIRKWVTEKYPEALNWLYSWDKLGFDPFHSYLKRIIHDYYYMEGCYSEWRFNLSRRIGGNMPVRGLVARNGVQCRLATTKEIDVRARILDTDCDLVLVSDWKHSFYYDIEEYPRFDPANPLKYPLAINYVRDRGFDEDIYSEPTYFFGLKDWIKAENLNPRYVNSYMENSFNAKVHVVIPDAWIQEVTTTLRNICDSNYKRKEDGKPLQTEFEGVEVGTDFNYGLVTQVINNKIKQCVNVMSGQGDNQGKMFWSRSFQTEHGIEKWEFSDIPTKYTEFIKTIETINKLATQMNLAGIGVDPNISNVSNEGVFNSGSQIYYSYLVYLDTLGYADDYILEDINRALWINFPKLEKDCVKLGFIRFAPEKQQDTAPNDRLQNSNVPS